MLLEKLCNASGVSGDEGRIRDIILSEITPFVDDIKTDSIGNIIALKKGESNKKRLMLTSHMDEVGFIVNDITDKGYIRFAPVGGIDPRVVISKRVKINDKTSGVIGIKAIHLTTKEERKSVPKFSDMFIDIGAEDKDEALRYVQKGDYISFDTRFEALGKSSIKAKAIDDRAGVYIMCRLLSEGVKPKYDTYFCFLTQEEVGLRGATCATFNVNPTEAMVLEATTCADVHNVDPHMSVTKMGGGAAISFMDRSTIVNKKLYALALEKATKHSIMVQPKAMVAGGNDSGIIHITRTGVPTLSVSVPARYIHSPASVASMSDIEACYKIAKLFLGGELS